MFVKMPQRNSSIEIPQPTSLRRSPRLLQSKNSPKTPILTSENTSSRKPQIRSKNVSKSSSVRVNEFVNVSLNCSNSANGYRDCAKSGNGSRRKSNFGSGICKEVVSLADVHLLNNNNNNNNNNDFDDSSVFCNTRSRRKSNVMSLIEIDSLAPVTPIDVGEKKCRGFVDSGTSGSIAFSLGDSERRITRSCSRKMGEIVEGRKVRNVNSKDVDVFDGCVRGIELRRCVRRVRGVIVDENRKGNEECGRRSLVCGLVRGERDSVSPLLCKSLNGSFEKRITRSASKRRAQDSDLCAVSASNVLRKGESRTAKGKKQECAGKSKVRRGEQTRKVFVCDSVSPLLCKRLGGSFERRNTRTASKQIAKGNDFLCGVSASNVLGKGELRKAREKKRDCVRKSEFCRSERGRKVSATLKMKEAAARDTGVKEKEILECGNKNGDKLITANCGVVQGGKLIGVKRKRNAGGNQGKDSGWSNEQEAALQRAYFAAKPSPHFWKKVSKLVPGKSAQECFDKVHSANLTPLSPRHSSRLKKPNSPTLFVLTGDELLKTTPTKTRRRGNTARRKSHVARKNVRHLLQKYCQDSEQDLFSVLEPSENPLAETLKLKGAQLTPIRAASVSPGSSSKCRTISSSGLKSRLSRFSSASKSPLTSPPVLKRVKNMALHEKYIDQLHVRDGKRKVASLRSAKSVQLRKVAEQNSAQRKVAVKAAKNALVTDARDVIEKFCQSQTNLMEAYSDSEDGLHSDNDDDKIL